MRDLERQTPKNLANSTILELSALLLTFSPASTSNSLSALSIMSEPTSQAPLPPALASSSSSSSSSKPHLALPAPPTSEDPIKLDVSTGESVSLYDRLGPTVVNSDGVRLPVLFSLALSLKLNWSGEDFHRPCRGS